MTAVIVGVAVVAEIAAGVDAIAAIFLFCFFKISFCWRVRGGDAGAVVAGGVATTCV